MEKIKSNITLTQAIDEYMVAKRAQRLSENTLIDYSNTYRKFRAFFEDDPSLNEITVRQIHDFINSLDGLSKKTVLNYHTGLSSLWKWAAAEGYCEENIVRRITPPKPEKRKTKPFRREEVVAMLNATSRSKAYTRPGKQECTNGLKHRLRDQAILLCLVDTGIRATELCELRMKDVSIVGQEIEVFGKGSKERTLPMSEDTAKAIDDYLTNERGSASVFAPLFASHSGDALDRSSLRQLIQRISERAGVRNAHPHRFRHTFAINFLRNGGDPYSLQEILGHSTMEMVKTYLALAQADLEAAHRKASPVMVWKLGKLRDDDASPSPAFNMNGNGDRYLCELSDLLQQLGERDREELLVLAQTKVRRTNGRMRSLRTYRPRTS